MKKVFVLAVILVSILVSCKKNMAEETLPIVPEKEAIEIPVSEECYLGILKRDTIVMTLSLKGNQVLAGNLSYAYFEKDKNKGTLSGTLKGDTLIADYTFMSEGISSVRQVIFLKKGTALIEGFGDVEDNKGKIVFKDIKTVKFDEKMVLSKVVCKNKILK